jgi:hypothetical protein
MNPISRAMNSVPPSSGGSELRAGAATFTLSVLAIDFSARSDAQFWCEKPEISQKSDRTVNSSYFCVQPG